MNLQLMLGGLKNDFKPLVMAVENSKKKLSVDVLKNLPLQDAKFDNHCMELPLSCCTQRIPTIKIKGKFRTTTVRNMGIYLGIFSIKEMITIAATIVTTEIKVSRTERRRREKFNQHSLHQTRA